MQLSGLRLDLRQVLALERDEQNAHGMELAGRPGP
jgi:hypothetical protein